MGFGFLGNIWNDFVANNSNEQFLFAGLLFAGLFALFWTFDKIIVYTLAKATKKTKTHLDDSIIDFIESISWPFFLYLAFYLSLITLQLPENVMDILNVLLLIFVVYYIGKGFSRIVDSFFNGYKEKRKSRGMPQSESMINVLRLMIKLLIWSILLLVLLSNFGVEITPLVAGLGVGGIAIGLALQTILGDLFSAFAIYFDKPFEEGDFIIVGSDMGVVKHIGIKTTRVEALGGQELVFSNSELTSSRINNYKKMQKRRVLFNFSVEYQTTTKQLKKINDLVKKIIDKEELATFDRCHFKEFGDSGLNMEVVYYIGTGDYNKYMDINQDIIFEIKEQVEKLGVGFAFPTRTVHFFDDTKKKK